MVLIPKAKSHSKNANNQVGRWIENFMKTFCHVYTAPKDTVKI